jgi:hypothetical protein
VTQARDLLQSTRGTVICDDAFAKSLPGAIAAIEARETANLGFGTGGRLTSNPAARRHDLVSNHQVLGGT